MIVTDITGQPATIKAFINIVDIPSQIFVKTSNNMFSTTPIYSQTFSELYMKNVNLPGTYEIEYKLIDDNPNINFIYSSSNGNTLFDDPLQKTTTTINGITTIEGVLISTITNVGIDNISLNIQESSSTNTSANVLDIRNNTAPTMPTLYAYITGTTAANSVYNFNWSKSDPDIALFNDVITFEMRITRISVNSSVIFTQTGIAAGGSVPQYTYSLTSEYYYLNSINYSGRCIYKAEVRVHDSYGGVSAWTTRNEQLIHL